MLCPLAVQLLSRLGHSIFSTPWQISCFSRSIERDYAEQRGAHELLDSDTYVHVLLLQRVSQGLGLLIGGICRLSVLRAYDVLAGGGQRLH